MEWRERDGLRWLQADLDGGQAAFSTRLGGVSEPPFDQLNLGLLTDDAEEAVGENRRRLAVALGFKPEQVVFARQIHGTQLIDHRLASQSRGSLVASAATKEPRDREIAEADGHVVAEPGLAPLVL